MLWRSAFIIVIFALPLMSHAAESFVQSPAYKECTQLASTNPQLALEKAESWLKIDQGTSALHCRAMALYGNRQFELAAAALSDVRNSIQDPSLRSFVARQASRAWMNANKPDAAMAALTVQLNEMTETTEAKLTSELLLDRAKLRLAYGQLTDAVQDLDHAVSVDPSNEEILLTRADSFLKLKDTALAKQDLQAILRQNPKHPQALERMRGLREPAKK